MVALQWEKPVPLPQLERLGRAVGLHSFWWGLCFKCLTAQLLHLPFPLPSPLTGGPWAYSPVSLLHANLKIYSQEAQMQQILWAQAVENGGLPSIFDVGRLKFIT